MENKIEIIREENKVRIDCPECKGEGQILFQIGDMRICPLCQGRGSVERIIYYQEDDGGYDE